MNKKWESLYQILIKEIDLKAFDQKFYSEREICDKFDYSRVTVRKCLDKLIAKGYLYKIEKSGTYISKKPYFDGTLIHWNLDKYNSSVNDFKFIKHAKLGECLSYTRRYFLKSTNDEEEKLGGIEEIFVKKAIIENTWSKAYEDDISISLYNFIQKYKLANIFYNKKEIKTFNNENKHFIMMNTDIFTTDNKLIAISTTIQPFQDFSIKYIDYTNQDEEAVHNERNK